MTAREKYERNRAAIVCDPEHEHRDLDALAEADETIQHLTAQMDLVRQSFKLHFPGAGDPFLLRENYDRLAVENDDLKEKLAQAEAEITAMKAERIDTGIGLSEQLLKATERAMDAVAGAEWWRDYAHETESLARWTIDRERADLAQAEQRVRELTLLANTALRAERAYCREMLDPASNAESRSRAADKKNEAARRYETASLTAPEPKE